MRAMPMWQGMKGVAHTLAYDGRIVEQFELPADELATLGTPTIVIVGGQTPWMKTGAEAFAKALPNGDFRLLHGQSHDVAADAIAPVLIEFFQA
jgi:pimeloyl-ACP methyl ester carboxylesterase